MKYITAMLCATVMPEVLYATFALDFDIVAQLALDYVVSAKKRQLELQIQHYLMLKFGQHSHLIALLALSFNLLHCWFFNVGSLSRNSLDHCILP